MIDVNKRVEQYVALRDARRELKSNFEVEDKKLRDLQELVVGQLSQHMTDTGTESLRTEHGTCYRTVKYSASLADPDAFMNYVINNQRFDLLDRRANVTAVKEFIKTNKEQPPGVNFSSTSEVGVRRANKSKDEGSEE